MQGGRYETSPQNFSASRSGRCRAADRVALCAGASLSNAAGALDCRVCPRGGNDIVARLMGQWLSERLGQPFVIENRPGGGGNIGAEAVVKAPPDGYTLLLVAPSSAINATLYEKLSFNFIRDIVPVASITRQPYVMVVNPSVPAKTVPELILYAKANPGKLNIASPGIGTGTHLAGELFKAMTGVNMIHVSYRAPPPAFTGAGHVPHHCRIYRVHQGRQAASASGNDRGALGRIAPHPDCGRVRAGLRDQPVVWRRRSQEHTRRDRRQAEQRGQCRPRRSQIEGAPCRPWGIALAGSPVDFGKFIADETEKWAKVIKFAGVKAD
jgi:Tripartite tricarboxylate transporter family receptor